MCGLILQILASWAEMATKQRRARGANAKGRSKGNEQFVPIPYNMARSIAWRSLSGPAVKVYIELRSRFNGFNNGELSLSMDEAKHLLGLGKSTIARALKDLAERGFIAVTRPGQWYGRLATTYAVTDRPLNGGLATNAWRHWRPEKTVPRSYDDTVTPSHGTATGPKNISRYRHRTRQADSGLADGTATGPPLYTKGGV